jgi:hypothetical protein
MKREVDGGYVFCPWRKQRVRTHSSGSGFKTNIRPGSSVKVAVIFPEGVLRLVPVLVVEGRVAAPPPRLVGVVLRLLALPPLLHPRPDRSSARAKNMAAILYGLVWSNASCI